MAVDVAIEIVAGSAMIGGSLGGVGASFGSTPVAQGVVGGVQVGLSLATLGGLAVAIFSKSSRTTALQTAGIGILANVAATLLAPASTAIVP